MSSDPGEQTSRRTCRYPGCTRAARLGEGRGAPPRYCDLPAHHRRSANKQRARLLATDHPCLPEPELDADLQTLRDYITALRSELELTREKLAAERAHHDTHPDPRGRPAH